MTPERASLMTLAAIVALATAGRAFVLVAVF